MDTDSDGTPDCLDECSKDPLKILEGDCGCGEVDEDLNGNGISDCIDICQPNVFVNSFASGYQIFEAGIEAGIEITSNGTIINVDVDFSAGDHIELLPGFEVTATNIFHAFIDGCN